MSIRFVIQLTIQFITQLTIQLIIQFTIQSAIQYIIPSTSQMNLLVFLSLLASFSSLSAAETLYHREGRFIDLAVHRYKTQLPSISDIANSFIHYRVPVAVFVPTVRLNIRSKQKRIPYSSFPSTSLPSKKVDQPADVQNKPSTIEQEPMNKSNKGEFNSLW